MKRMQKWMALGVACLGLASAPEGKTAGLLVADGGFGGVLEVRDHAVDVTINNGIAVTRVTQVFQNKEKRVVEALYTFPVPKGASVANFSMWINGKEMVGEVLEKKRARQIYESYKRTMVDPGLLEQVDHKTFEMRIFPIGPEASQKVEITYYQELEVDADWATYVYPLATSTRPGVKSETSGKFSFTLDAKSAVPITKMESPSHGAEFVLTKVTPNYQQASLETTGGSLAKDFVLAFQLERAQTGFDLLTFTESGEDGYFCLTLTPGQELEKANAGMDYVFVLDISGSMADDGKLLMSKDSIAAFLESLGPEDRFEVMSFNTQPHLAFRSLKDVDPASLEQARSFLQTQEARGGTSLLPALGAAMKYASPDRQLNVVVLSDGLTENRDRSALARASSARPANARIFCVGVGNDVDRPMLEQIAHETGGLAAFVSRGDDFGRQARAFRRKLSHPVATGMEFTIEGVGAHDLAPAPPSNLYHGMPVKLYGRYKNPGQGTVRFRASVNGVEWKAELPLEFPASNSANPELARMWAMKRVDELLKRGDAGGSRDPVAAEVVRLGETYSIVTEQTSFIVLENDSEYKRWKIERKNLDRHGQDRKALAARKEALEKLRERALADLGPEAVQRGPRPITLAKNGSGGPTVGTPSSGSGDRANLPAAPTNSGGGGSVSLLFLAIAALFRARWLRVGGRQDGGAAAGQA